MQTFLKKIFKKKQSSSTYFDSSYTLNFNDLKLQNIELHLFRTGNDTVFSITEKKTNTSIVLDKELSLMLMITLQNFIADGNISNVVNAINTKIQEEK